MKHTSLENSETFREFAKILQKNAADAAGLKKTAQVQEGATLDMGALSESNDPKKWQGTIAKLKATNPEMAQRVKDAWYAKTFSGKDNTAVKAILMGEVEHDPFAGITGNPGAVAVSPPIQKQLSSHQSVKTADKEYDAVPDSKIVLESHPGKAMVEGELVENVIQQQAADLAVAEKSATIKVLKDLAKVAAAIKDSDKEAYKLVMASARTLHAGLKK